MEATQKRPVSGSLGRWSSTRRGTLTLALVSALVAAGILLYGLHQYRKSVTTPAKPATVLIANRFIEKGTSGAAIGVGQYFRTAKVSDKQVAVGALTSSASLHGQVAAVDIYPGQQLAASDFVGGGLFYSKLPRNMRAVSVPVDASHGMIGNIKNGDRADVYVSFKKEEKKQGFLRLVAPDVVVLDAGQTAQAGGLASISSSNSKSNVVLEVTAHQAGELAFSSDFGKVWLVLSPAHGTRPGSEVIDELSILAENRGVTLRGTK
jgi:Flp pilus assembly protein CpaB